MLKGVATELCVGVSGPLSGPLQRYGEYLPLVAQELDRAQVAARVILRDDQASAAHAVEVANELVAQRCRAVIGHFNSSCALAVAPIYARAQIPFLAPCSTHPGVLDAGAGFALRYCADDVAQVACMLRFIDRRFPEKSAVAAIRDDSAYGRSLANTWQHAAMSGEVYCDQAQTVPRASAYVYFGKLHHALGFRVRQLSTSPDALFLASDDAHISEYLDSGQQNVEGTYVVGHAGGHGGAVRCAAQHLAEILAAEPGIAHAPLRARLQAGNSKLRFDARGQRLDVDWAVFAVRAARFEVLS